MKLVPGHAICACGWHGTVGAKAPCPACSRPAIDRMDDARIAVLQAVRARADAAIEPGRRNALIRIGVIAPAGRRPPPGTDGPKRGQPRRSHVLTALGLAVLETLDANESPRLDSIAPKTPSLYPPRYHRDPQRCCPICGEPGHDSRRHRGRFVQP